MVRRHQFERVGDERVGRERDGFHDHPRLGALDLVDLPDLGLDREVAVDHSQTSLTGQRDGEPGFGDGVHRRRDDRDLDRDSASEPRRSGNVVRENTRLGRDEQDVVEGQPFPAKLSVELEQTLDVPRL